MTVSDDQVAPHMTRFLGMLDAEFRRFGVKEGLPTPLREAVTATPRHCFVHRFRVDDGPLRGTGGTGPLRDGKGRLVEDLKVIYSDAVMRHVDATGEPLRSSNSQPSYILFLLHLLGLEPGHTVLEIGSGSGWLAAIMARLVGQDGRVTGIELIPDLADQSRADLAASSPGTVDIITGDGTRGHATGAPYDRAIIMAATWDVPVALLEQVAEAGRVLIPVELRGGDGCAVTVLRRQGDTLVGERTVQGWFVPLLGTRQDARQAPPKPLPDEEASGRYSLPLCMSQEGGEIAVARQFRAFLGRTEPDFVIFDEGGNESHRPGRSVTPFGIADPASGSLALWQRGKLVSYGGKAAASCLARAYARWASLGLPGTMDFTLEVHPTNAAPAEAGHLWVERRGETALVWRLKRDAGNWRNLTDADFSAIDQAQ